MCVDGINYAWIRVQNAKLYNTKLNDRSVTEMDERKKNKKQKNKIDKLKMETLIILPWRREVSQTFGYIEINKGVNLTFERRRKQIGRKKEKKNDASMTRGLLAVVNLTNSNGRWLYEILLI